MLRTSLPEQVQAPPPASPGRLRVVTPLHEDPDVLQAVAPAGQSPGFISLDFIYVPSGDVAGDLAFYRDVLGGEVVFAIEAFETRVAEVRLSPASPHLLLAGHLEGEAPVLVHRVADLETAIAQLAERGLEVGTRFDIPPGPCTELRTPGGQRIGLYEATRPEVYERFPGRIDFEIPPADAG